MRSFYLNAELERSIFIYIYCVFSFYPHSSFFVYMLGSMVLKVNSASTIWWYNKLPCEKRIYIDIYGLYWFSLGCSHQDDSRGNMSLWHYHS